MKQSELKKLSLNELQSIMLDRYDGNAGEIINGFRECGCTSAGKLKKAMIGYILRVPAYDTDEA